MSARWLDGFRPSDRSGFRGMDWSSPPFREALASAGDDLAIHVDLWLPPGTDPLTVSNWWAFREPCDCPDTSFGRNPHRWDCEQTPIWVETIRDLDTNPWTVVTNSMRTIPALCTAEPCTDATHWELR